MELVRPTRQRIWATPLLPTIPGGLVKAARASAESPNRRVCDGGAVSPLSGERIEEIEFLARHTKRSAHITRNWRFLTRTVPLRPRTQCEEEQVAAPCQFTPKHPSLSHRAWQTRSPRHPQSSSSLSKLAHADVASVSVPAEGAFSVESCPRSFQSVSGRFTHSRPRPARVGRVFDQAAAGRTTARLIPTATRFPISSTKMSFADTIRSPNSGTG